MVGGVPTDNDVSTGASRAAVDGFLVLRPLPVDEPARGVVDFLVVDFFLIGFSVMAS
jgi:hypothetical protein